MSDFDPQPGAVYAAPDPNSTLMQRAVWGLAWVGIVLFVTTITQTDYVAAATKSCCDWQTKVADEMPLLGHRNWILVVDSAYPLQTSPGVETIETNEAQEEVVNLCSV